MAFNSRWLSTTKSRLGKLLLHGCEPQETRAAGDLLKLLAANWRDYVVGSEGYVTAEKAGKGDTAMAIKGLGPGLLKREVTWGDEDVMVCHVNNVMYIKWAESARVNWSRNIGMYFDPANRQKWEEVCSNNGTGLILGKISVDYKFPVQFPDKISVYHKLSSKDLGTHNFGLDVIILSERHQRVAARCHEDIVTYDYKAGIKAPIPGFMKDVFQEALRLQKEAAEDATEEMKEIEDKVGELEKAVLGRAEMK